MRRLGLVDVLFWAWVVSLALLLLQPRQPDLPAYKYGKPASADYQAGGASCDPVVLATIRDNWKAFVERKRCSEAAEEHRLKSEDLIQQSRAADAAEAQARTNYDIARLAFWGTIGGFLTLIAAAVAAYFAREASRASWEMLRLDRVRSASDVRLQVYFETQGTDDPQWITIVAKSHGGAVANDVEVTDVTVSTTDERFIEQPLMLDYTEGPDSLSHIGASRKFVFGHRSFVFTKADMAAGAYKDMQIHVGATLSFKDWTGEEQTSRQRWGANVQEITDPWPPYTTVKLQASLSRVE